MVGKRSNGYSLLLLAIAMELSVATGGGIDGTLAFLSGEKKLLAGNSELGKESVGHTW